MKSNFKTFYDAVAKFNAAFNRPLPKEELSHMRHDEAKFFKSMIEEELGEIMTAHENRDRVEVLDGFVDLFYFLLDGMQKAGISPELFEKAFNEVQRSNMDKVCKSKEEAVKSCAVLREKTGRFYEYEESSLIGCYVLKRSADGKAAKPYDWKAPNLRKVIAQQELIEAED